jgi:hypothetical protein
MKVLHWLVHEIRAILTAMLFFLTCFAVVVVLKELMVEQYDLTAATSVRVVMLALVTAKVVVLFERVSLGRRIGAVEVVLRTALYSLAAFLLLLLEHGISERKEAGGFFAALGKAFQHPDMPIIWATLICVTLAFFVWTAFAVLRRSIGRDRILAAYLSAPSPEAKAAPPHRGCACQGGTGQMRANWSPARGGGWKRSVRRGGRPLSSPSRRRARSARLRIRSAQRPCPVIRVPKAGS